MTKTLGNTDASGTEKNVPDVQKYGDPDAWQLLNKAWSDEQGWMRSTKVMIIGDDTLVQVSHVQAYDGVQAMVSLSSYPSKYYAISDDVVFVPGGAKHFIPALEKAREQALKNEES